MIAPLLVVEPLADVHLDLEGVTALAFTGANAVRAFAALSERRDLPVAAVGRTTATAAEAEGFVVALVGHDDGAALAAGIAADPGLASATLLHPTAEQPAGDLAAELRRRGVRARAQAIYRTVATMALPEDAEAMLNGEEAAAVLIHSPRAGRVLAGALASTAPDRVARHHAFGLSAACIAPLAGLPFVTATAAPEPGETSLLDLLDASVPSPKPVLGPAFWAALVFGLACVLAGGLFAWLPRPRATAAWQAAPPPLHPLHRRPSPGPP